MTDTEIITLVANIINGIGLFFVCLSMVFKKKRNIILCQAINQVFAGTSYFMLGGYAALMLNIVTLIMDIFILLDKQNKVTSIVFALATFILGTVGVIISANATHNTLVDGGYDQDYIRNQMIIAVVISYLPVLGTSLYNVVSLSKKIPTSYLRFTFAFSCLLWAIFSIYIKSYVGFVFNVITVITYIVKTIIIHVKGEKLEN